MPETRVYAVASGKGGVGKTTTAVNLGAAAAAAGRDVVLVDFDLGMANVGDVLDLDDAALTLHDVLADDVDPDDAIHEAPGGFDVLPGGTTIEDFGRVDPSDLRPILDTLQDQYDLIILDTGGGLSHDTTVPLGLADRVILTSTPQDAALGNTTKTKELAERLDSDVEGILLTRVSAGGVDSDSEVADTVGAPVLGSIPEDRAVPESQAVGEPLETYAPDSPATQAYREFASDLLDLPLPRNWEHSRSDQGLIGPPLADERPDGGSSDEDDDGGRQTDEGDGRSLLSRLTGGLLG